MKVTVENTGPCRKVLHVSAPVEVVLPEYNQVAKAVAGRADTRVSVPARRL